MKRAWSDTLVLSVRIGIKQIEIRISTRKKFYKLRGQKTVQIELEDDVIIRERSNMTPDKLRISLLKEGINPYKEIGPREWNEHQITYQSMYGVVDPYVSTEKSPKFQELEGSNMWNKLKNRGAMIIKDQIGHRYNSFFYGAKRIKKRDGYQNFDVKKFPLEAQQIYIDAHNALCERNTDKLHRLITEHAFGKLWPDVQNGSVQWELVNFIEPSRVISVRVTDNPYKSGNDIAQIIVRMHSSQKVAIFDRFGHLLLGSQNEPRNCLEYVVFENHIASWDGIWRFHDKVYPKWLEPKASVNRPGLLIEKQKENVSLDVKKELKK